MSVMIDTREEALGNMMKIKSEVPSVLARRYGTLHLRYGEFVKQCQDTTFYQLDDLKKRPEINSSESISAEVKRT